MPISPLTLQRRHAELGRIRLGQKNPDKGFPMKLSQFRFTSVSERYITDLAGLYGGTAEKWDNNGVPSWQVLSDAQSVPVIVVKNGLTQWMETWVGGGCVHRCDGERQVDGTPCDPEEWIEVKERGNPKKLYVHTDAKPTTRLSVMLPELEAVGVWRMESHGWNSAAEIPAVAELATFVGDLVPAHLHLQERRAIKDGKTSRFVVPVLDLQIGAARLREIAAAKSSGGELAPAGGQQAIESGRPQIEASTAAAADPFAEYAVRVEAAQSHDDLKAVWADALAENLVGTKSPASEARGRFFDAFQARSQALAPKVEPDADGAVDAQVVEDADAVWQQVLKVAGEQGMTQSDIAVDYAQFSGGETLAAADAGQLQAYLESIAPPAEGVASGVVSRATAAVR